MLNGLRMSLECYRPNVLCFLLGVAFVNQCLNIFLDDLEVLANYSFGVNYGKLYF